MRSIVLTKNGGRPRRPCGAYGAINASSSVHGTTRSICARNSRLRVRLVLRFNPSSVCCMGVMIAALQRRR